MIFFKINGKVLSRNPKEIEHGKFKLQNNDRAIDGTMVVDIIAVKNKISFSWDYLSQADMKTLTDELSTSTFSQLQYRDVNSESITEITAYAEDITYKPHYDYRTSIILWKDVKVGFMEK
jgi:hypothetical protein